MAKVGRIVKFTAQDGKRDTLVEHLLRAARSLTAVSGCKLYAVYTSPAEANAVWVVEAWESQADIDASLSTEAATAAIQQVLPLLVEQPERVNTVPVGGKGLD